MARRGKNSNRELEAAAVLAALVIVFCGPALAQAIWAVRVPLACILGAVLLTLFVLALRPVLKKSRPFAGPSARGLTLPPARPLRSYNMATLESVRARPLNRPPSGANESRYAPGKWGSPDPASRETGKVSGPEAVNDTGFRRFNSSPVPPIVHSELQSYFPSDLVDKLRSIDWFQFEKVVAWAYAQQGFRVTRRGGANPDGGLDLILEKNGTLTAVQCKQWKKWKVAEETMRGFVGALHIAGIDHGVFVILGECTGPARQLAEEQDIEIINETGLARMLGAAGAQYDPEALALLNDERKYCPKCESEMVLRSARLDSRHKFWGCSTFPKCKFKIKLA